MFSALYNGPYMIWRSNITVWNSHDVLLLLLFTSTLGVIIEVNIFYTNTITCGLSLLRWDLSPSSKHLHWCSDSVSNVQGNEGAGFGGDLCLPWGQKCTSRVSVSEGRRELFSILSLSVGLPKRILFQWNSSVVSERCTPSFTGRKDVFWVWDCKGDCAEHQNNIIS